MLAFLLLPVAVFTGGAFVYHLGVIAGERSAARMAGSTAGAERARPASTGGTMGPVADSPHDSAKPEPAPPPTSSPPAPVAKAEAAGRSPGAVARAARAQSAARAVWTGILDTTHLPAGRRIVVDGHVVGTSPRRVSVRCGARSIRIGELPKENIEVPCGGEITFDDE
jgi:hypothetical protein